MARASAAAAHPCGLGFLLRTYDRVYEYRIAAGQACESAFSATPAVVSMPDEPACSRERQPPLAAAARALQYPDGMPRIIHVLSGLVGCVVVFGTSVSHAEYNAVAAAPQSVMAAPSRTPEPVDDYSGWLVLSYLATPALAIGLPTLASELKFSRGESVALGLSGLAVAVALPVIAHWLNDDDWRGWRALIGLPACTAVGFVFGLILGSVAAGANKSSGAGDAFEALGAFVFAIAGASTWSVYDIAETASERGKKRTAARRMRFAALPQAGGGVVAVTGSF